MATYVEDAPGEGYLDICEDDGEYFDLANSGIFPGIVIAGFFTGGALAVRGGLRAARNSAIGGAVLLAIFEGVGIAVQRMMAENTRLDVPQPPVPPPAAAEGTQSPMYA
ncbi:translocase of the inner membrane [Pseudocyphellaria aurata]|nr:translocase of the inner membrane [Pseudocyphellaria aurata]